MGTPSPASCRQIQASRSWQASANVGPAETGKDLEPLQERLVQPLASLLVATTISRSGMFCSLSSSFSAAFDVPADDQFQFLDQQNVPGLPAIGL